jgi:hypothetical protein
MRRQWWAILIAAFALLAVLGCSCAGLSIPIGSPRGSGEAGQQVRDVRGVREVELASFGNLHVEFGEQEELRIEADKNLLRYIESEVRGGRLVIRHRRGLALRPRQSIEYYLTVNSLDAVKVSGAGNVSLPDFEAGRFTVEISGAGNVEIEELRAEALNVRISGAGNVEIEELRAEALSVRISGAGNFEVRSGEVNEQAVAISGAGDYRARDLESDSAEVHLSGLGSATLWARENLDVHITGAGSVRYAGRPTVEKQITGVGSVEAIGE